jgi:probable HAF family extracellular repeat protein
MQSIRNRASHVKGRHGAGVLAALVAGILLVGSSAAAPTAAMATSTCRPSATVLKSPRPNSLEVQAKAINDRGDVVGFADTANGNGPQRAILWKGGRTEGAVDLGVLPGYVASEAYGVNDRRVVVGVLYDRQDRQFPFRWANGRMSLLKDPLGRLQPVDLTQRNSINARGEMAATLIVAGQRRAVRWTPVGKAAFLPALPGHRWTNVFGINDDGIVSGWSRKLPNEDGEENPVLWTRAGKVVPLRTFAGQADGIAEATNENGMTVGYLGNLGTETDPEMDQFAVWSTRTAVPKLLGPRRDWLIGEFVDLNDRGQAIGMTGPLNPQNGFSHARAVVWRPRWPTVRPLAPPPGVKGPVVVTEVNDLNAAGAIVGNVFGLAARDYGALRSITPVLWRCAFAR